MATLKQRLHRKNSSGGYDVVHLETSASCVLMSNGNSAETEIMAKLPMKGTFSADIDATDIDPGVWNLNGYDKTSTSLGVFPYGDDPVYGTFIQYPGSYKTQVILAGSSGYAVAGFVRRFYSSSKTWCAWKSTTELPDHNHDAGDITSGILPAERGGTGSTNCLVNAGANAIMKKASDGNNMWYLNTASGALYATAANGAPKFGTLPVAQGGTGATDAATARSNLGAAAASHGTHVSYGTSATAIGSTAAAGSATTVSRSDHTHSLSKSAVTTALGYTPPTTNTTYSNMTGATSSAAGKAGLVPAPAAGKQTSFLRGDGTWVVPTNTTYSNFVKSGSTAAAGLVPAPPTTAGTTKYLREDGTWQVPPDTNTVYTHPTTAGNKHIPAGGSSGQILRWSAAGTAVWGADNNTTYGVVSTTADGLAPKRDGSTTKFLRADGTWAVPPDTNTTYTLSSITGTLAVAKGGTGAATATANYVFAAPNGSNGAPTFRKLVAADIPSLAASKITSGTLGVARGGTGVTSLDALKTALGVSGGAKIAAGSYVGADEYGEDNPCVLNLGFRPKILFLYATDKPANWDDYGLMFSAISSSNNTVLSIKSFIWLHGLDHLVIKKRAGTSTFNMYFTTTDTGISWYCNEDKFEQFNYSSLTYSYVAIG